MKILLLGKNGQVGWELQRSLSTLGEVISVDYFDTNLCGDLSNLSGIAKTIQIVKPNIVVNAAAHTAVDKAETEIALSRLLNTDAVEVIAKETAKLGALLVHYSTDYVFDGLGESFRTEEDNVGPLNIYGQTKFEGEKAIRENNPRHFIFRTSWVYATRGHNFAKTMLNLARSRDSLSVIDDQFGAPTGADFLADCTSLAIRKEKNNSELCGTYHLVASGVTTWFDYAKFVFEIAQNHGEELQIKSVSGIPTISYPTPAKRPTNSRLDNGKFKKSFDVNIPDWKFGVERMVVEVLNK